MNRFHAVQFWWLAHELMCLEKELGASLSREWSPHVNAVMVFAEGHCKAIGLGEAAMLPLYSIKAELQKFDLTIDYATDIKPQLKAMRKGIEVELDKRRFAYVPPESSKFFAQERLFGEEVYVAFPSARFDLTEAGNCLACGMNSAAGFHLMRAAEIALWELGRDRQIPLAQSGKIEFSQWGVIISELEKAIEGITQWPNSPAKEDAHRFYNPLLVDIRAFNDGWRRHLAHVRKFQLPLAEVEALALCGHVERFLKSMATKISEGNHTPIIWK